MSEFISKEQLFVLIAVSEPYKYVTPLLKAGAIRLRPFTAAWGGKTYVEPEYKVVDQAKFDAVVEEARAKEAEQRLMERKKLEFDSLLDSPIIQEMFKERFAKDTPNATILERVLLGKKC